MSELTYRDFGNFFGALWGYGPFPWQERLLQRLVTGKDPLSGYEREPGLWPDLLDLPTGSGKTATLDIAIFHLALDALRSEQRCAPLRIGFVVDRRIIVDDAYTRAERIAQALSWSLLTEETAERAETELPDQVETIRRIRAEPIVRRVAAQLRGLAGRDRPPLIARAVRGGAPREDDWALTPVQPTILCSTVDQVGSRLLFRGYGVSDRMKPIHAGLLGSDCLLLLDEAHLSEPFRQTLKAVERLRAPDAAPFGFAVLTATPNIVSERPFGLGADDISHPILSARIGASKPARLVEARGKQGVETEVRRADVVSAEVKEVLSVLQTRVKNPAVGVVLNRVARARAVFERLQSDLRDDVDVTLIIGPARSVDRAGNTAKIDPIRTRLPDVVRTLQRPLIVVATQTIEAGVDIDFDGLVTEAAALDALRQRFGRLNRAGRKIATQAAIVAHEEDISSKADDSVYGDRIAKTWLALKRGKTASPNDSLDFGISAIDAILRNETTAELIAETEDAPILLPAYVDLWSQTSPIPSADPNVALFLHGPNRSPASVQIVWRADIESRDLHDLKRSQLIELLSLVPPRAAEAVEVPIWTARAWLRQADASQADLSDAVEREPELAGGQGAGRRAFRWAGEDSARSKVVHGSELQNGDLIVVPADYGGYDQYGWNPRSTEPVTDVAEKAAWPYRGRRFVVRVAPKLVIGAFRHESVRDESLTWRSRADDIIGALAKYAEDGTPRLIEAVLTLPLPSALRGYLDALGGARGGRLEHLLVYGFGEEGLPRGVVFVASRGIELGERRFVTRRQETDEDNPALPATEAEELSIGADQSMPLMTHCRDVRDWAEGFADRAGLHVDQLKDLRLAAFLHDPGKADPRFQAFLAGGDPYGPDATEPLAKSGRRRLPADAWHRAGLPIKWRHEALSVRLAMLHPEFSEADDPKLVLWLIGTHHGFGRPFFPHADDQDAAHRPGLLKSFGSEVGLEPGHGPQSLAFDFDGSDWTQMFEYLKQKYGIWGLARLETFVRLADHRASEAGAPPEFAGYHKEAAE
jgi:CRISPR-associated endonuclease/helicase Cas3